MPPSPLLDPQHERRIERRWDVAALLVFALACAFFNRSLLGVDLREVVPVAHPIDQPAEPGRYPGTALSETDHNFVVWLVSRNARTLVSDPLRLYEAEPCFPAQHSLALGEPGISLGVLGIPAHLLSRDPIATYNWVLIALPFLSAFAMYWVVKRWTALPAAGIAAGLLYGFHSLKVHDPVHFYVYDTVWTVLALFFAERLFSRGRWQDALALGAAIAMQLAGSLYPVIAAALAGLPFLVWLLASHGVRGQRPLQWVLLVLGLGFVVVLLYSPYLALSAEGALTLRPLQVFRPLSFLLPDQEGFPGWLTLGLLLAAFAQPASRGLVGLAGRDPRFVLLLAIVLIQGLSIGSLAGDFTVPIAWQPGQEPAPNLYMALAQWLPGLGLVRAPAAIFNCAVPLIAILSGVGLATLLRRCPARFAGPAAALAIALAFVDVMRPPLLGLTPHFVFSPFRLRPPESLLDFYAGLERAGNSGPLLLLPATPRSPRRESFATLLCAYHQRPIGQCYNSYHTPEVRRVREISRSLPEQDALLELAQMGFTTLIVEHGPLDPSAPARRRAFERAAAEPGSALREIASGAEQSAYEIALPAAAGRAGARP